MTGILGHTEFKWMRLEQLLLPLRTALLGARGPPEVTSNLNCSITYKYGLSDF